MIYFQSCDEYVVNFDTASQLDNRLLRILLDD